MSTHKVVTVRRGTDAEGRAGFAARCEEPGCGAITFGGFPSRSAARRELDGHEKRCSRCGMFPDALIHFATANGHEFAALAATTTHEDALEVGQDVEGEIQNTNAQKENQIMTSMTDAETSREAAPDPSRDRGAHLEHIAAHQFVHECGYCKAEENRPCSMYTWCQGHSMMFPESDGSHMAPLVIGEYEGGEPKTVGAIRYEVSEYDDVAHWSFSMPEGGEWSFGADAVDREIGEGIDELLRARTAIKAFLAAHDMTSGAEPPERPQAAARAPLSTDPENPTVLGVLGAWYPDEMLRDDVFASLVGDKIQFAISPFGPEFVVGRHEAYDLALALIEAGNNLLSYGAELPEPVEPETSA